MTIYSLTYYFSDLKPICCSMPTSNCCFLTCIQISQEAGQVVWYSHLFQNFPQFIVIHLPSGSDSKASTYNVGDLGLIPGLGRSGQGNGSSLQYSCLENPMDRVWRAVVHGVSESNDWTTEHILIHTQNLWPYRPSSACQVIGKRYRLSSMGNWRMNTFSLVKGFVGAAASLTGPWVGFQQMKISRVGNGERSGSPLQCSCLGNPMDRGA